MPQLNPEFFVSQLFWLVVTFTFLLIFLWRISLPRIGSVLKKREKKINDDIATAKKLQAEAEVIQKKIEEVKKENEIYEFLKNKYGEWIVYDPEISRKTFLLWVLPLILFVFGGLLIIRKVSIK